MSEHPVDHRHVVSITFEVEQGISPSQFAMFVAKEAFQLGAIHELPDNVAISCLHKAEPEWIGNHHPRGREDLEDEDEDEEDGNGERGGREDFEDEG